jgi:chromosomal replication initiator protein
MPHEQIWQSALGEIEINLSRANFITWFKETFISSFENGQVIVCVPNAFVKKWLEEKYHKNIVSALENVSGQKINNIIYKIELRKSGIQPVVTERINTPVVNKEESKTEDTVTDKNHHRDNYNKFGLNPRYVFDNFIVGKNNELAYAACRAVVNNLGKAYNPLFIYGGVGLGKTH